MSTMKNWSVVALGFGMMGLAAGCSVDASSSEELATDYTEQALCSNQQGVNAYMAALGTASANELRRWHPQRDFQWNNSTQKLELSEWGKLRCMDKKCFNIQELLNMQNSAANNLVVFPGGDKLETNILRDRLKANWDRQITCLTRPDNHTGDDCPHEYHDLALKSVAPGACDKLFTYNAYAMGTKNKLQEAYQLRNMLIWLGYEPNGGNPYLAFSATDSTVTIDPTVGLTEGDATSSGSCAAACTMISSTSIVGACCSCNGVTKKYSRSAWSANTYLCK